MQIRACDLSTSWENILTWNRTLNVFDLLGMNVGSLQKWVEWLINLKYESESAVMARKLAEAKSGRASVEEEIRKLKLRLLKLGEVNVKLGNERESKARKLRPMSASSKKKVNDGKEILHVVMFPCSFLITFGIFPWSVKNLLCFYEIILPEGIWGLEVSLESSILLEYNSCLFEVITQLFVHPWARYGNGFKFLEFPWDVNDIFL